MPLKPYMGGSEGHCQLPGVANCMVENSPALTENIDTLVTLLDAPCLGKVPRCVSPEQAAEYLDWHSLLDHKYG